MWQGFGRRIRRALDRDGLRGVVRLGRRRVRTLVSQYRPDELRRRLADYRFDTETGVDTGGYVSLGAQGDGTLFEHGHPYVASPHRAVRRVLAALPVAPADFTFIDIGCGKGRALFVAAEMSFHNVIGVELSDMMVRAARRNVDRYHGECARDVEITIEQGDATTWPVPDLPAVLYLFNPFGGPLIDRFVDHVEQAARERTAPLFVALYDSDPFYPRFESSSLFEPVDVAEDYQLHRALR